MPPVTTRTLNPLPFEHLEPKRFEDLVRQLAYNFRPWRQLEATGRAGSDYGFDARGWEITELARRTTIDDDETGIDEETVSDRLWLIQCKREGRIGPSQIRAHLEAIPTVSRADLHGVLFVASCNFSVRTREAFRQWCTDNKIREWHLWGKAEIEDLLFQSTNDNLLFAYFGISLQIKRQKIGTAIRRTTSIKRRLVRLLKDGHYKDRPFIIRDISDTRYPSIDADSLENSSNLWRVFYAEDLSHQGLKFLIREHYAYYDQETGHWDMSTADNTALPSYRDNPWHIDKPVREEEGHEFWCSIPERKRCIAAMSGELPYAEFIEIDEIGDSIAKMPTIYVNFKEGKAPFSRYAYWLFKPTRSYSQHIIPEFERHHIRVFPENSRNIEMENAWASRNGFSLATERTEIPLEPPEWLVKRRAEEA